MYGSIIYVRLTIVQWRCVIKTVKIANFATVDMAAAKQTHRDLILSEAALLFKRILDYND